MSALKNINGALIKAYQSAVPSTLPTAYEVRDFQPPASGNWARVQNFPAESTVNSLGDGGHDNITGFFQIDFFVPENSGTAKLHELADGIIGVFKNGARFYHSGQEVKVRRSQFSPIRRDDSFASYGITISVYWDSPNQR